METTIESILGRPPSIGDILFSTQSGCKWEFTGVNWVKKEKVSPIKLGSGSIEVFLALFACRPHRIKAGCCWEVKEVCPTFNGLLLFDGDVIMAKIDNPDFNNMDDWYILDRPGHEFFAATSPVAPCVEGPIQNVEFKLEVGKSYEVRDPRYVRAHNNETVVKIDKMRVNQYGEKEFRGDQYRPLWYYEDGQYTGQDDTSMDFYDLVREIQ
ncbi:MAG: hypothetical protein J7619_11960 [Dyadobacter sp.]|uniref:hypothetical protein n=1 Tax=Dyadobacter sp. TaxID=1914288 RepID=UPI001B00C177|nr:hypothetical protein [Dyadobacter sp.]MBO9613407.1 hypothetical protein [Dyadobacter sp.]